MQSEVSRKTINNAFALFCSNRASLDEKNWSYKLHSFISEFSDFVGTSFEERIFSGWVAAICEQSYYLAAHEKDLQMRVQFEKTLKDIFNTCSLPRCLSESKLVLCGKKQPTPIESIEPTFDRFRVLEDLPNIFAGTIDALILGGSMSYVPFLGVRSDFIDNDFSDIDLIFIQSDSFFDKNTWGIFIKEMSLYSGEKKLFLKRVDEYKKLLDEGKADILSQRFKIKGKKYTVSTHFFPKKIFKKLVSSELKKRLLTMDEYDHPVRDYRIDAFNHPCQARLSFDGSRIESGVWSDSDNLKYGHIATVSGFTIKNKKLYPGPYLTVISPAFKIFYTKNSFAKEYVREFKKILEEQVFQMSVYSSKVSYAKAHNRYYLFCPGRYDRGYDSYVSPEEAEKMYIVDSLTARLACGSLEIKKDGLQHGLLTPEEYKENKKKLECWTQRELASMDEAINSFIEHNDLQEIDLSLFKGTYWLTVTTVKARKNIVIDRPDGLKCVVSYSLFPNDIMSSSAYSKLSNQFGKVYINSHFDPIETESCHPISYSIIVKLLSC
jgi:hypothetical protein